MDDLKLYGSNDNEIDSLEKIVKIVAIQTIKEKEQQRPDIVVIDNEKRECNIIDIAVHADQNIKVKEQNKNLQIPGLEITDAVVVEYQSHSYICRSWCFGNS